MTRELTPDKQDQLDAAVARVREALAHEEDPKVRLAALRRAESNYQTNKVLGSIMRRYGMRQGI